jgi:hypothetical protein
MSSATRRRLWDVAQDRPDGRQGGDADQKLLNDAGAHRETVFIVRWGDVSRAGFLRSAARVIYAYSNKGCERNDRVA